MRTFTYEFEELPLVIVNGIEAGLINGQAEIGYEPGYFQIGHITLEGFGERINGKRQWPQVPAPDTIAAVIRHRLENEWYDKVYTAFAERVAEERECAADNRADMRREQMREMV